ncbi:rhomboid-like protein [Mucilaginibacter mallensis]|uniref:Rhomboid-like protein n=1 Tax=Mucilaginibacter mallensis TaxID=652787 RepID=A0A1H2C5K4_MUCMA|nr:MULTISPECIES: rhomboid family intramembrane serine protease [Mucilaginibacter]MBB6139670.1 rhomboid-like protein [Mucilaginibacter sp. X5P1]SDT65634.1 rhomboid-like protein [Mucilaginibacter mallensis]
MQFSNIPPVVKNLLIINIICFIPFLTIDHGNPGGPFSTMFGVYYFNSPAFRPWQLITYMFLHGSIWHILFNMFALFSFGPIVEYSLGSKRFFNFYFICGIGAVLLQMLVQAIQVHSITGGFTISHPEIEASYYQFGDMAQKVYDIYHGSMVGASGAIFGLLIAFGMLFPNMELMIMFIPVPVKAKYIIPFYVLVELTLGLGQFGGDNVAHFAHLGGALIGFILIKAWNIQRT